MAPPLSRRLAWPLAAAVALVFVVGLALQGERPNAGLTSFKAAGVLTAFVPDEAYEIEVAAGSETWRFRRESEWRRVDGPELVTADLAARIDLALRLLRDAAPLRVMTAEEVAQVPVSEYALWPTSLRVRVRALNGTIFAIQFGGRNPLGSARYARVDGSDGVSMLPTYVAEAWEQVIGGLPG